MDRRIWWATVHGVLVTQTKESAGNVGDLGSVPGFGRSPGEGQGYPLQYSGLENLMDCLVQGVSKSRSRLSAFHFHLEEWSTKILEFRRI